MRITNKMMSGNSLANINNNKQYLDKLNNQMATEKKITRPSDDPIIAIRALRLRSELSEVTQYYGANVPDAQAWVSVTQSAISSTKDILSSLKAYADQGANGTNTASDRQKIYDNMSYMRKQVYQNGNVTNAGRSVFTGYRTGEALTFKEDTVADYRGIHDGFNASDISRNTYISSPFSLDSINSLSISEKFGDLEDIGIFKKDGTDYTVKKDAKGHYETQNIGGVEYYFSDEGHAATYFGKVYNGCVDIGGTPHYCERDAEGYYIPFTEGGKTYYITDNSTVWEDTGETLTSAKMITINGTDHIVSRNSEGHYDPITVSGRTYNISDSGEVTYDVEGEVAVLENKVNRIRLSYDNIDQTIKSTALGRYDGDEAGDIDVWGGSTDWERYWQNGKLTGDGLGFSSELTVDGLTVKLSWDEKGDQTLDATPMPDDVYDFIGRFKEGPDSNRYGGISRDGNVYATKLEDKTKVIYRTELDPDKVPSIPADSRETHPVDGLQKFEIKYNGQTYYIKKLEDGKFWAVSDPGDTQAFMDIDVANNTDGTLTVKVPTDGGNWNTAKEWNVFNISADARSVTSFYHESILTAKIVTSDATVAKDSAGKGVTAYEYLALDPNNKNSDNGYIRTDEEDITDPTNRTSAAKSVYLLADTGELVFGSDIANTLSALKDIPGVDTISVVYDKSNYKEGDVRPEHYFDVTGMDDKHTVFDPIVYDDAHQAITYTIGTNQSIKINTNADEVFDTQIAREMDDIMNAIKDYDAVEVKVKRLKEMQEDTVSYGPADQEKIKLLLDAANKELDYAKNKLQRTYEDAITQFGKFFDQANKAETACGTVDSRLTLVSNRLMEEKTTVTTLASENENVDITNIAVEVSEANLVYNAALMATGRISQQTLVDYI